MMVTKVSKVNHSGVKVCHNRVYYSTYGGTVFRVSSILKSVKLFFPFVFTMGSTVGGTPVLSSLRERYDHPPGVIPCCVFGEAFPVWFHGGVTVDKWLRLVHCFSPWFTVCKLVEKGESCTPPRET